MMHLENVDSFDTQGTLIYQAVIFIICTCQEVASLITVARVLTGWETEIVISWVSVAACFRAILDNGAATIGML